MLPEPPGRSPPCLVPPPPEPPGRPAEFVRSPVVAPPPPPADVIVVNPVPDMDEFEPLFPLETFVVPAPPSPTVTVITVPSVVID